MPEMFVEKNISWTKTSHRGSIRSCSYRAHIIPCLFKSLFSATMAKKLLSFSTSLERWCGLEMDWNKGRSHSRVDGVPRRQDSSKSSFLVQCTWLEPCTQWWKPIWEATNSNRGPALWDGNLANPSCHGNRAPSFNIPYLCFLVWGLCFGGGFFPLPFNLQVCEETSAKGIKGTYWLEATGNHRDLKVSEKEKITHRTWTLSNKLSAPRVRAGHVGLLCLPLIQPSYHMWSPPYSAFFFFF